MWFNFIYFKPLKIYIKRILLGKSDIFQKFLLLIGFTELLYSFGSINTIFETKFGIK